MKLCFFCLKQPPVQRYYQYISNQLIFFIHFKQIPDIILLQSLPIAEKKPAQHGIAQTLHHTLVYQYISHCQRNKDVQLTGQAKLRVLRFKSPKLHHIIDMQSIDHSEYNNNTRQGLFQHNTQYIIHKRYPCNSSTKTKFSITLGLCKFW